MTPKTMPKTLLVVGSGAIGIEFAFYADMGVDVTVIETVDRIYLQKTRRFHPLH